MIDNDNDHIPNLSYKRLCTNGRPNRGKVFLPTSFPASPVEQQNIIADDLPPPGSSTRHVDEATSYPTVEDYANLFFGSDDDDNSSTSSTGNSIQSLTMIHHHQWEPEPHPPAPIVPQLPLQHRHKRLRVSFTNSPPTIHALETVPPASTMTTIEKSDIWLQSSDIESLKASAQASIQAVRDRAALNAREYKHRHKFRALMVTMEKETDSSIRGLEHKVYRRKETRKTLIQDVIECQKHINGLARFGHEMSVEERRKLLANASLSKSEFSVKKALLDANDDYKEVYGSRCFPTPLCAKPAALKIRRVSSGVVPDDYTAKSSL